MRRLTLAAALALGSVAVQAAGPPPRSVVFFGSWSAFLDDPAKATIADAVVQAKQNPGLHITLKGYASTVGSNAANELLARLRAQIVLDELVADGVSADRISMSAFGPTNYALDPLESRRVEIAFTAP
jgi:outer membrane protein OmpA-like peptidoglycan-associated protein